MVGASPFLSAEYYLWRFLFLSVILLTFFIVRELAALFVVGGCIAKFVALSACLAMLMAHFQRNQDFCNVAALGERAYQDFSISRYLKASLPIED